MFTGIINHIGSIQYVSFQGAHTCIEIECQMDISDLKVGDSVAVNGVCLTLTRLINHKEQKLFFDLGSETLEKTTLGNLRALQKVHLEKAIQFSDRLNGHLVQGHADGIGILIAQEEEGLSLKLKFACSNEILRYCIDKGSIAIDGVSLTINQIQNTSFEVCLVPHTLEKTCFSTYQIGHRVNLENDLIGKYVEKLLLPKTNDEAISWDLLKNIGYVA